MPSRKQRRRQEKERRHEWEYVYVDDSGQEVEVAEDEAAGPEKTPTEGTRPAAGKAKPRGKQERAVRKVDPPSLQRVLRRAAVFTPILLVVVYLLRPKNATVVSLLVQVVVLLIFFLPFSYFMDTMMYRGYRKRIGDPLPPRERKPRAR